VVERLPRKSPRNWIGRISEGRGVSDALHEFVESDIGRKIGVPLALTLGSL
jgi:hypothetical protein